MQIPCLSTAPTFQQDSGTPCRLSWRQHETPGPLSGMQCDFNNYTQYSWIKSNLILNFHHSYKSKLYLPLLPTSHDLWTGWDCAGDLPALLTVNHLHSHSLCCFQPLWAGPRGEGLRREAVGVISARCGPPLWQASQLLVLPGPLILAVLTGDDLIIHSRDTLPSNASMHRRPPCQPHLTSVISLS